MTTPESIFYHMQRQHKRSSHGSGSSRNNTRFGNEPGEKICLGSPIDSLAWPCAQHPPRGAARVYAAHPSGASCRLLADALEIVGACYTQREPQAARICDNARDYSITPAGCFLRYCTPDLAAKPPGKDSDILACRSRRAGVGDVAEPESGFLATAVLKYYLGVSARV